MSGSNEVGEPAVALPTPARASDIDDRLLEPLPVVGQVLLHAHAQGVAGFSGRGTGSAVLSMWSYSRSAGNAAPQLAGREGPTVVALDMLRGSAKRRRHYFW
jgi:hypothetical protein